MQIIFIDSLSGNDINNITWNFSVLPFYGDIIIDNLGIKWLVEQVVFTTKNEGIGIYIRNLDEKYTEKYTEYQRRINRLL